MAGPCLVGVDCGTQSAKVVIFDALGREVSAGTTPLRPMERPEPGVAVHPDDDLWDAICSASRTAVDRFPGDPGDIVAIGLCPIRCCKAFLDADGALIEPVISWMDDRAYRSYLPASPSLRWATTASGYLTHRFTGELRDTVANNIALQWPIDMHEWRWSDDHRRYERCGVGREMLFDLLAPGDVIGPLTGAAALATGLPAGVPVVATANDKAVEMLGAGPLRDTAVLISLGTYIAAIMNGDRPLDASDAFWTNFASVPGGYLYESHGVRRGMWTLSWFVDMLGPELAVHVAATGRSREEHLEAEARVVPAGSDGLVTALDWLAPTDRPHRRGTMAGFDARHTRGHVYRSILESIALTMKDNVDAMVAALAVDVDEVVLTGGGSASPLFARIFADVFDLPVERALERSGASLGAAMCAAAGVGVHADIPAASAAMARTRDPVEPDPADAAVYRGLLGTPASLRDATDPWYERGSAPRGDE